MRIFVDIGHPAHVHYLKNFISIMQGHGHHFLVTARQKEFSHQLLKSYGITYSDRGKGGEGILGRLIYTIKADFYIFRLARKFKPDIYLSFCTPYLSHVGFLTGKPSIVIDDSDGSKLNHVMYVPFARTIMTPVFFKRDFGKKHLRFNGYFESIYLHPGYFTPERNISEYLGIAPGEQYAIIRFVSWKANHDMYGQNRGLSAEDKLKLINHLDKIMKVFISSEIPLNPELEKFRLPSPPDKIHSILASASLFIGESLTMASEAALLGTPSLCISTAGAGTLDDQKKRGLVLHFDNLTDLIIKCDEIIRDGNFKNEFRMLSEKYFSETDNITDLLVWFTENYPKSIGKLEDWNITDKSLG